VVQDKPAGPNSSSSSISSSEQAPGATTGATASSSAAGTAGNKSTQVAAKAAKKAAKQVQKELLVAGTIEKKTGVPKQLYLFPSSFELKCIACVAPAYVLAAKGGFCGKWHALY
jgi:hypothetical protein